MPTRLHHHGIQHNADASKGYESHDEPVLGSIVLVLVLSGQADPGTVIGLPGCIKKPTSTISNPNYRLHQMTHLMPSLHSP
jgi:hypothetical protein